MSSANIMHPLPLSNSTSDFIPPNTTFLSRPLKLRPGPRLIHRFTCLLLVTLGIFGLIGSIILFAQSRAKAGVATLLESILLGVAGFVGWRMLNVRRSIWWRRVWMGTVGLAAGVLVVLIVLGVRGFKQREDGLGKVGVVVDSLALAAVCVDVVFVVLAMWLPENNDDGIGEGEWEGENVMG